MGIKTIQQLVEQEKGKLSQETIMQEQKIGTNKEPINPNEYTNRLNIETYHYDEREYLKGKYYNLSNITPNIFNCTFEKSVVKNKKEQEYKKSLETYCNNFKELGFKGLGALLMGSTGNGKTYYSDCVYNELSRKGYVVYRTTISDIFYTFKETFKKDSKINTRDVIRSLKECDLIILDDVGSETISENWGEQSIYSLIDFLITNDVSLMLSTNLSLEDLKNHLSVKNDGKLLDRVKQKCKLFVFDWESRRGETYKKEFEELY